MRSETAIAALEAAFDAGSGAADQASRTVGVFGDGLPDGLFAATGLLPFDVKLPPPAGPSTPAAAIAPYCEDFLDDQAREFLNRLFSGAFDGLPAIVFSRDDQAAMTAYHYAGQLRRLGFGGEGFPRLILWNLVHGRSAAVARFNRGEADRLFGELSVIGVTVPDAVALAAAFGDAARRTRALDRLAARRGLDGAVTGGTLMRWRNAGRFLPAAAHADLLEAVADDVGPSGGGPSRRIGLVGSATACPALYATIERHGTIVCDLQPFGDLWPGPAGREGAADLGRALDAEAGDPLNARANPPALRRQAMVARLIEAGCALVVCQIDRNDDTFGWEWPGLKAALEAEGIATVDLGFRDMYPDCAWHDRADRLLAEAAGGGR